MPVRRISGIAVVISLTALALVGCSSSPSADSCEREYANTAALDLVHVSDSDFGDKPDVTIAAPLHVEETAYTDTIVGDGNAIITPDQNIAFDITIYDGTSGAEVVSAGYNDAPATVNSLARWVEAFPTFDEALQCATEGSRVVMALPPEAVVDDMRSNLQLEEDASIVVVLDLQKVYLAAADGADQYNDRSGMPTVVHAPDGRPGIIVPDSPAPTDLTIQVLKKGDGETVTGDAPVRLHYTGVTWDEGTVFETTWDGEAQSITLSDMPDGFEQAVEGQTVGSQILVVVPPELGYGSEAQGKVPADSTLVYVIDILGVDEPVSP